MCCAWSWMYPQCSCACFSCSVHMCSTVSQTNLFINMHHHVPPPNIFTTTLYTNSQPVLFAALLQCLTSAAADEGLGSTTADVLCLLLECDPETPPEGEQSTLSYLQLMHASTAVLTTGGASAGAVVARIVCQLAEVQPLLVAGGVPQVCGMCTIWVVWEMCAGACW